MTLLKFCKPAAIFLLATAQLANAEAHDIETVDEVFLPENAILDTSILFSIGAREAQQELRGSYGWDTFQEGLVEGVYFRFDPDGYARFSPNPRLDADLFEVLCRPRTLNCVARKGPLSMAINAQGLLQLSIEGVAAGDQFFISDMINEIELPDRIMMPLDPSFENVLAVGGDLIIRRGQNQTNRISLIGFSAVTSYLRWILAEQDYLALPRNWPIPNGNPARASPTLTAPDAWRNIAAGANNLQLQASQSALIEASNSTNEEIASLRALVEQMSGDSATSTGEAMTSTTDRVPAHTSVPTAVEYELQKAMSKIAALEVELARLGANMQPNTVATTPVSTAIMSTTNVSSTMMEQTKPELVMLAEQIQVLASEFGISPNVAALLLRHQAETSGGEMDWDLQHINLLIGQGDAIDDLSPVIDAMNGQQTELAQEEEPIVANASSEFILLTDYFRSETVSQ